MKFVFLLSMLSMSFAVGCAHSHSVQGVEKKSEIPEGIRVAIGSKEVNEGEILDVLKSKCKTILRARGGSSEKCVTEKVGEAVVLKILDHDSAIVEPRNNLKMEAGMSVEKRKE